MSSTAIVRGERVTIVGPRPLWWTGLGQTAAPPAVLVEYPDGEVGAVSESEVQTEEGAP